MQNPLETMIEQAQIPGLAVAFTSPSGKTVADTAGVTNLIDPQKVTATTVFEAASLSKPVFAYLVIKLAERKEFDFDLDRPLHEYVPETGFGPPEMRKHENYKLLTARLVLSHQAGLPNEFKSPESEKYISAAGENFNYSAVAYGFLAEVVKKVSSKSLETLAQEAFTEIGMTNSSFMPPTGCCLIKLPDEAEIPTAEYLRQLLKNTLDRHGQLSIIFHQDKLYVAERAVDGSVQLTEKNSSQVDETSLREIKARFAQIPPFFWSEPIPIEARELSLITAIVGHPPEHASTIAIGHYQDGSVNLSQQFYKIQPAGSLYTTAEDYGKFLKKCMNDELLRKEMFGLRLNEEGEAVLIPSVPSLADKKDKKAIKKGVSLELLERLAWGLGIGLQHNSDGSFTAFHWGDNGTGRNFAAINLHTQQAVACFTNSANGSLVFQKIAEPVVGSLKTVSQWLSQREKLHFNSTALYRNAMTNTRAKEQKEETATAALNQGSRP
ncbi:putative secreted esterase [Legionella nautarum]|uniref:Putative secreted esterase n=1 Tax=Legionella nautarum TaxID=45070 RepID=A0A0W0WS82_9GAMM|nr:serine hydrolase domain-containing protein [Legionella nautarum]KTD35170.1 putative secreted esterase [Legionella nautarum]